MNNETDKSAGIIWKYHHLNHKIAKADCILVLGSNDTRVAEKGADLFLKGYAPFIIFSGGHGVLTKNRFKKSEAEVFAGIAIKRGVPPEKILIENKSTNTGENIIFTKRLLAEKGLRVSSFIVVQKPYMERRTYATFKKLWPSRKIMVTSPRISFKDYPNSEIPKDLVINIMVGDLQRIRLYPKKGFQIFQRIPVKVWNAFERLAALGYTKHLIKERSFA